MYTCTKCRIRARTGDGEFGQDASDTEWLQSEREHFDTQYDRNKDGSLDYNEILLLVRPEASEHQDEEVHMHMHMHMRISHSTRLICSIVFCFAHVRVRVYTIQYTTFVKYLNSASTSLSEEGCDFDYYCEFLVLFVNCFASNIANTVLYSVQ